MGVSISVFAFFMAQGGFKDFQSGGGRGLYMPPYQGGGGL